MRCRFLIPGVIAATISLGGCATLTIGNGGYGIMLPYGYEPVSGARLDILPEEIRTIVARHLDERLGRAYQRKLSVANVFVVDTRRVGELEPKWAAWPTFETTVPAYLVCYRYSEPSKGLKAYYARIGLNLRGNVVREIGLPRVAAEPEKAEIIPAKAAATIARKAGTVTETRDLTLRYNDAVGSLMWVAEQSIPSDIPYITATRVVEIDAHSAVVISAYVRYGHS